jgi:phosphoribosylanthranilate isomerase
MTLFKICGLRDPNSALVAAESGASFLGFAFVEGVRRQLLPERGAEVISEYRKIAGSDGPKLIGLFANQPAEFIDSVAKLCGLDYAQLCGDEPPDFWNGLSIPVIRQVKVRDDLDKPDAVALAVRDVEAALGAGHLAMLDKHVAGALGGTGVSFDWEVAREIARDHNIFVAGGLTPENVAHAIHVARPWGVDVSSGVETNGEKDAARIRAFARAVSTA